jgi:replicative superfamily II helicase
LLPLPLGHATTYTDPKLRTKTIKFALTIEGVCATGMLDVQQIFGRAGRPQFEDTGLGIIITSHDKLVSRTHALSAS